MYGFYQIGLIKWLHDVVIAVGAVNGSSRLIRECGYISFYGYFPMAGVGELKRVDNLISWSDAVDSLEKVIPKHFEDYKGYSKIVFNDVRLTYFRTLTENGQYKVMPVYVFSQVEEYDVNQPIQLIIIDARDGTEVNVMQDESRKGMVN